MTGQTVLSELLLPSDRSRVEVISDQNVGNTTGQIPDVCNQDVSIELSDQDIVDDQANMEPVRTQEISDSVTHQDVKVTADQGVTELTDHDSASQGVDETVNITGDNVSVDQPTTGQDTDKVVGNQEQFIDQEVFDDQKVDDQKVDETITSQIKGAVNDQEVKDQITTEVINNIQGTDEIDNQNMLTNNTPPPPVTDQSGSIDISQISQSPAFLPSVPILQDPASPDLVDTPHYSKGMLEQGTDIWQSSFILTQPSCIDCPSELRSLWREPVMDNKIYTVPLQHYSLSSNSDQVSYNDDVI